MSSLAEKYLLLFRQMNQVLPIPAPVASFTSSITNLSVAFTDTSTGSPTSWLWDFGDGTTSALQNPVKVYAGQGTYNVVLTATNAGGSDPTAATPIAVNTAFRAAVLARSPQVLFGHAELSGTVADNAGSLGDGTYTSVTLAQTGITGTNDAGLYNADSDGLAWPSVTLNGWTLGWLVKSNGTLGVGKSLISGAGGGDIFCSIVGGAVTIGATMDGAASTAALETDTFLSDDTWTLIFLTFNSFTGHLILTYSTDGTVNTPATVYEEVAAPGDFIGTISLTSKANLGASGGLCDAVFLVPSILTHGQRVAIAESIWS